FVAGFFTTFSFSRPGIVTTPLLRRLLRMMLFSDSKTPLTCLRDKSVSLEIAARISDLVGAPPFFAMLGYSHVCCFCVFDGKFPPVKQSARNIAQAHSRASAFF